MNSFLGSSLDTPAVTADPGRARTSAEDRVDTAGSDHTSTVGWLTIVSGAQAGAETTLEHGESVSVGRAPDDHIVLRDMAIGESRVTLLPNSDGVQLRVLEGIARIDGAICATHQAVLMPYGTRFSLGGVVLAIEARDRVESSAGTVGRDASADSTSVHDRVSCFDSRLMTPEVSELPGADEPNRQLSSSGPASRSWYRRGGSLVATILMLGGIVLWVGGTMTPPDAPRVSMASLLESTPFSGLDVSQQDSTVQLSGYLESRDDAAELEQLIRVSGLTVDNRVLVGERITTQVSDIFRVNGVQAEVSIADGGEVSIVTRLSDEALLRRIEELVIEDVPGVASVKIDNQPPPVVDDSASPIDPGKRVAMVVSDEPAHIITEDKSRYFVGAILPSGHRLASIDEGKVMLEKMGVKTVLEF